MSTQNTLPDGYSVVQIDKQWYPVKVERYYSASYPDGFLRLDLYDDGYGDEHYPTRKEAIIFCQKRAQWATHWEQQYWEELAVRSDVYPDRCNHYRDLIKEIIGHAPFVYYYHDRVSVSLVGFACHHCQRVLSFDYSYEALCIEDALEIAANAVYASHAACTSVKNAFDIAV